MSRNQRSSPYGVQLFDDLHNYLPGLLYHPEQFNSVRECLEYVQDRARHHFNLYDANRRNFTIDNDSQSEIDEIEQQYNRRERIIRETTNQSSEELLQTLLNDFMNTAIPPQRNRQQNPFRNIMSMFTTTVPLSTTIPVTVPLTQNLEPVIVRPTQNQINTATNIISTTATSEICSICQESLANSEVRRIHHCRHMFHRNCIDRWFEQNVRCPVCRHDIRI
jgi:hypothetical protein